MPRLSFRARILLLVLVVGLAPLAVLGFWLTGRTARTGEALLRERLREVLTDNRQQMEREWVLYRSRLLDLAEVPEVRAALSAGSLDGAPPASLVDAFAAGDALLARLTLRGRSEEAWTLERGSRASSAFGVPLTVRIPLYDGFSGDSMGAIEGDIHLTALWPRSASPMAGAILTAVDPASRSVLIPTAFDPALLAEPRFLWNDEPWVVERADAAEPRVQLIAAAPLDPFRLPFAGAARSGLLVLIVVVVGGVAAAAVMSGRLTSSLKHLAGAAAGVAGGDLSRTVRVRGDDEVGRVAAAFNTMTENLRRTLDQLAERESLAAVNEFAAALAHEVRNPLTAIQLDLQEVEERLGGHTELRALQTQALDELRRLDRTVAGALDAARSGHVAPRRIRLADPLDAAARIARPAFDARAGTLYVEPTDVEVDGDPDALQRVFLNLFLNAAAAIDDGGRADVAVHADAARVTITVRDDGPGVPADQAARIFEPFHTSRPAGTGIGLTVARRIVSAHRGTLDLVSGHDAEAGAETTAGTGAVFRITLPRVAGGTE